MLSHRIPPDFRGGVSHRVSPESSYGCCLFCITTDQLMCASFFPYPLLLFLYCCCIIISAHTVSFFVSDCFTFVRFSAYHTVRSGARTLRTASLHHRKGCFTRHRDGGFTEDYGEI
ncbi:unnamed protein product [Ascophyllum nodosum]